MQIFGQPSKTTRVNNLAISFTKENTQQLHHPHDNALVINLSITVFNTRWVLVDNGRSTDIIYYPTFQQIRINKECLLPLETPLVGFGSTKVFPVETTTLLVTIGTYP